MSKSFLSSQYLNFSNSGTTLVQFNAFSNKLEISGDLTSNVTIKVPDTNTNNSLIFKAGSAVSGNNNGGDLFFEPGLLSGTGTQGQFIVKLANNSKLSIINSSNTEVAFIDYLGAATFSSISTGGLQANTILISSDVSASNRFITFVDSTSGQNSVKTNTAFTFNPSTGNLISTSLTSNTINATATNSTVALYSNLTASATLNIGTGMTTSSTINIGTGMTTSSTINIATATSSATAINILTGTTPTGYVTIGSTKNIGTGNPSSTAGALNVNGSITLYGSNISSAELRNCLSFSTLGFAVPGNTILTRSIGTRIILFPTSLADYSIGIEGNYTWFSVPSGAGYKWYINAVEVMRIDNNPTGSFLTTNTINATATNSTADLYSNLTANATLNIGSGMTTSATLNIGTGMTSGNLNIATAASSATILSILTGSNATGVLNILINSTTGYVNLGSTKNPANFNDFAGSSGCLNLEGALCFYGTNASGSNSNCLYFDTNGGTNGPPTFTNRSVGTRIVMFPSIGGMTADYAIGMESGTMWLSVPNTSSTFKWYGGTTEMMSLTNSILTINTINATATNSTVSLYSNLTASATLNIGTEMTTSSTINIATAASSATAINILNGTTPTGYVNIGSTKNPGNLNTFNDASGALNLEGALCFYGTNSSGSCSNCLYFNNNSLGAPTLSTRSIGTRIVLWPTISINDVDFAIGMNNVTTWFSVPNNSGYFFRWYGGTTDMMNLSNSILTVPTGNITTGNITTVVSNTINATTSTSTVNLFTNLTTTPATLNIGTGITTGTINIGTGITTGTINMNSSSLFSLNDATGLKAKTPFFRATRATSNQTFIPSTTIVTIVFNNLISSFGCSFNTTNGTFTASVAGVYFFTTTVYLTSLEVSNADLSCFFTINGGDNYFGIETSANAIRNLADACFSFSNVLSLSFGDSVQVRIRIKTGGDVAISATSSGNFTTNFSGFYVSQL